MKQMSDDILWSFCLKGNKEAFEQLYRRYYSLLFNYGCKITGDKSFVQDTIQNLFVKLISNHKNLSETPSVKGYLFKSFRNQLLDSLKKDSNSNLTIDQFQDVLQVEISTENDQNDDILAMLDALEKLTFNQREILYLFYIKEFSHKEIANILGINYQSSKNRLSRSLVQLRNLFFRKRSCL